MFVPRLGVPRCRAILRDRIAHVRVVFADLAGRLPADVRFVAAQLSGHEDQLLSPHEKLDALVEMIGRSALDDINVPCVLYGID
jgi:surfactin synthase thioesterase subunit